MTKHDRIDCWIECPFCFAEHMRTTWAEESEDIEAYHCDCGAVWYEGMPDSKEEALPDD